MAIVVILGVTTVASLWRSRRDARGGVGADLTRRARPPGLRWPSDSAGSLRASMPMTSAEATTTRAIPSELDRCEPLAEHEEPGERSDGGLEAEQDPEDAGAEPAQREQLEGVGQDRGEHGDADSPGQDRAVPLAGRADPERQRDDRRDDHGQREPLEPLEGSARSGR